MNIKQYIFKVLNNKEILDLLPDKRVFFLHANTPNKKLYLEYEIVNEFGTQYSEGKEDFTTYIVQIDIFSTQDYGKLENTVKKIMIQNNFSRDMAADLYETDTKLFHKAMRFSVTLEADN